MTTTTGTRTIVGEHSSFELAHRNPAEDRAAALASSNNDHDALMFMYRLGYDMSQARVVRSR